MTVTEQFRPATLDDVVGQQAVVAELRIALEAAQVRGDMPGHMLFEGPAGTGKTTLSLIVAHELGGRLVQVLGPSIRSFARDLLPAIIHARDRDVIFIDEIHRMSRPAQENLFPIMEDGKVQDGTLILRCPSITFVGATTDPERLLTPMLDRFTRILKLTPYSAAELGTIVTSAARKLGCELSNDGAMLIGEKASGVPRVALRMMLAARDYAYAELGAVKGVQVATAIAKGGRVIVSEDDVQNALSSTAYEWRMTGRNAAD